MDDTRAFYWIADRHKYINEAINSAKSVKKNMPDVTTIIGCTEEASNKYDLLAAFDWVYVLVRGTREQWFLNSTYYQLQMLSNMNRHGIRTAVYMDTDTFMCAPAYDLFDIVFEGRYSIAGAHAPGRYTSKTVEYVPDIFPEINIGVNPMYVPDCEWLWRNVYDAYYAHEDIYGNNDQGVLREQLYYEDRFKLYILPPEYNMRLFPSFVNKEVKIIHGRFDEDYQAVANKLNASQGMRLWYQGKVLE